MSKKSLSDLVREEVGREAERVTPETHPEQKSAKTQSTRSARIFKQPSD